MKFIVSSSVLLRNLSALSGVISSSNTLPILDDFLFELKDDQLVCYGFRPGNYHDSSHSADQS